MDEKGSAHHPISVDPEEQNPEMQLYFPNDTIVACKLDYLILKNQDMEERLERLEGKLDRALTPQPASKKRKATSSPATTDPRAEYESNMNAEKLPEEPVVQSPNDNQSQGAESEHADVCGLLDDLSTPPPEVRHHNEIIARIRHLENRSAYHTAVPPKKRKNEDEKVDASRKKTKELLESIDERLEYLEQLFCAFIKGKTTNDTNTPTTSSRDNTTPQYRTPLKNCMFCKGNHWASECTEFATLSARRQRAVELNKCERCLFTADHLVTACPSQALCYYCKAAKRESEMAKHHTAFCSYHFKM
ncbi:hypothetical protein GCK32_016955 [Trichostrongylus colubriformis]|uniref:Uncharacterized protein n=1 Tax=Trichostrongylus colubriformis TaxID=6319 RepID=A0AAN8F060_TRICO